MPFRKVTVDDGHPRARTLHVHVDDAILEAAEGDVAAVIGDSRPHPRLDQILDQGHSLGVCFIEKFNVVVCVRLVPSPSVNSGAPDM